MQKDLNRRNFFGKWGIGLAAIIALRMEGIAKTVKAFSEPNSNNMKDEDSILKIKPLGFQWDTQDPFLFCVHHEDKFPKGNAEMGPVGSMDGRHLGDDFIIKDGYRMYHGKRVPGFPGHPHRGFETVTVVRQGFVDHADSLGAAGRYGQGDVQWMTAGKGVQHSEMFPLIYEDRENPMELFQIWLNLPKKNKMVDAHFKMLWSDAIPKYSNTDSNGKKIEVEVMAGSLENHKAPSPPPNSWASDLNNEVAIWNIHLEPGAHWTLPKASVGINRTIYYYEGDEINLAGKKITKYHAIEVLAEHDIAIQNGNTPARILVLQGRPINEPVMQYGPFVMNTKEEINQAFEDYHNTQFGGWPWKRGDQVHDRHAGRFAIHADGTKELKS
ncbi:MAG: pirin family protein [Chitinophagales bacterium]|nr:pirin family protein [Chitinophagales bacterium]